MNCVDFEGSREQVCDNILDFQQRNPNLFPVFVRWRSCGDYIACATVDYGVASNTATPDPRRMHEKLLRMLSLPSDYRSANQKTLDEADAALAALARNSSGVRLLLDTVREHPGLEAYFYKQTIVHMVEEISGLTKVLAHVLTDALVARVADSKDAELLSSREERPCAVCGGSTPWKCTDCFMSDAKVTFVCEKKECREFHVATCGQVVAQA